ncbi:DNA-binding transcriptional regulator, XRE-family HTH domain [Streptoalloteichus tenebrarius]|uniref:DNA-binding transcriptional regulator, XRE-family HTH domain n=3 Tax=Actinomycetes TaxID=1760 RepID=A0ABT1I4D5_STRSD|nr:helix-turn-helix domain-containing protein [Streptoalloteichus tenebrarius]MCP2262663.1 DNA-binding transcriptional regulator, XRE-family HTH domain [Streptoalloteichus tenebrarius]
MKTETPGPGRNVAIIRKQRGMSQVQLARAAGVSVSLLSKIEIGDWALSPGVAAALARGMGVTLDEVLGQAVPQRGEDEQLKELRAVMRRFDLPGDPPSDPQVIKRELATIFRLRGDANLRGLLTALPQAITCTTNYAHAAGTPSAWSMVADVYSAVYYLAARHRWMELAELAVVRQQLAAERADPLTAVVAVRDEAGAFLNSGDFAGGLAVINRAIVRLEGAEDGPNKAWGLGQLHMRGLTLAGRLRESAEVARHAREAVRWSENFAEDVEMHGMHFGPENAANHLVATFVDLEQHRKALDVMRDISRQPLKLPPTRRGHLHLNVARAKLALKDREGALESLTDAWEVTPQMARVHPTSQEVLRVLITLHRRSNPKLVKLASQAGVTV